MIIRIFHGSVPQDRADSFMDWARANAIPYITGSPGLRTLMIGRRPQGASTDVLIATLWTDLEAELATLGDLGPRAPALGLPDWVDARAAEHFEAIDSPLTPAVDPVGTRLRVLRLTLKPNVSGAFFDHVRAQQRDLLARGDLVAGLVGRRTIGPRDEYASIALWRDDASLERATGGAPDRPVGWEDLAEWAESYETHSYEAVATALARA
jgi:hypothetical protein